MILVNYRNEITLIINILNLKYKNQMDQTNT